MKSRPGTQRRSETAAGSAGRTVSIGIYWILAPVLLVAVVAGGFLLGRVMASRGAAAPSAPVAPTVVADNPAAGMPAAPGGAQAGAPAVVEPDDQALAQMATARAAAADPSKRFDPNTVYELQRLPHALLDQPAPDFTVTEFGTGAEVSLSDYRGRSVFLDFWGTWCGPCRIEMPWIEAMHEKYADQGLAVLGFSVGDKYGNPSADAEVQQFVDQYGMTFPVLVTDQQNNIAIQEAWSVVGYPSAFMIDAEGVVVDYHRSMFPNQVTLDSRLQELLLGAGVGE